MNVVLTHGYFIEEDEKEQKIMRPYPPLGLLYISAYLEDNNIDHQVFDSTFFFALLAAATIKSSITLFSSAKILGSI